MWPSPQSSKCQAFSPKINSRLVARRETSLYTADSFTKSRIHSRDLSEFSNSFDMTYSNTSHTPTSRQNYDLMYLKEYKQIEGELDKDEIDMKTYNFSDKYDYENAAKEFNAYFRFLENLGYLTKKKDQRLSASLFRGLLGVEKTFKKLISQESTHIKPAVIEPKKKIKLKEISTQTQEIIIDDTIAMTEEELETLKKLRMKLEKIKFSKISLRLCDLYDSLIKINTEIPELSFEPETVEFESLNIIRDLETNVKQFQSGIKNRLSQLWAKKVFDIECQTEFIEQTSQAIIPDNKYEDLEIQIGHLRQRYDRVVHDKSKLEEEFHRNNLICQDIAKRYNDLEKESFTYEEKKKYLEDAIKLLRQKITDLSENLNRKRKKKIIIKKKIEDLNVILTGKRTRLNHLLNDIYQIKIHWRVSQEKLHQIMEAWEKTTGVPFDFNVNIDQIIEKYNIKKSDSEASIHLSDDDEVEKIGPQKEVKSIKKNKKISSPESSGLSQEESISSEENKNSAEIPEKIGKSRRIQRRTRKFAQTQPEKLASRQNTNESTRHSEEKKIIKKPSKIFSTPTSKEGNLNADSNKLATPHHENNLNTSKLLSKRIIREESAEICQNTPSTFENTNSRLIESPEDLFISSLNENQLQLYLKLKEQLENDALYKKQQKLLHNSKWTQYTCEFTTLYTPRSRSKSRSISRPKRPYTRAEGDTLFVGNPKVLIHKPAILDNFNIEYQGNLDPAKAKKLRGIGMLISIFKGDPDFEFLSPNIKKEMIKCLDGHDDKRCSEECIHLKRVLQVRARSRGVPYPIKTSSIDADL
ncbi:unnamed protein product [Blepharisma stoltei]|uniref:Uncharacterized protein n=1 Tax=Blepharisma stoltei TaxID=1481888 RepID=A0AAU9IL67_9CILI|nr:unnamed protein product [Blepharisma stoltei]